MSEALKREHARQNKPQKKNDQNNQKKPNSPKKSPSDNAKKTSNQANQKNSTNPKDAQNSNGNLPKKDVERKLDELSRKEGETRRRMSKGNRTKGAANSSKKDW